MSADMNRWSQMFDREDGGLPMPPPPDGEPVQDVPLPEGFEVFSETIDIPHIVLRRTHELWLSTSLRRILGQRVECAVNQTTRGVFLRTTHGSTTGRLSVRRISAPGTVSHADLARWMRHVGYEDSTKYEAVPTADGVLISPDRVLA